MGEPDRGKDRGSNEEPVLLLYVEDGDLPSESKIERDSDHPLSDPEYNSMSDSVTLFPRGLCHRIHSTSKEGKSIFRHLRPSGPFDNQIELTERYQLPYTHLHCYKVLLVRLSPERPTTTGRTRGRDVVFFVVGVSRTTKFLPLSSPRLCLVSTSRSVGRLGSVLSSEGRSDVCVTLLTKDKRRYL